MYEDLVKAIRQNTCHFDACGMCPKRNALCMDRMALQAADAIEELSREYDSMAKTVCEMSEHYRRKRTMEAVQDARDGP